MRGGRRVCFPLLKMGAQYPQHAASCVSIPIAATSGAVYVGMYPNSPSINNITCTFNMGKCSSSCNPPSRHPLPQRSLERLVAVTV